MQRTQSYITQENKQLLVISHYCSQDGYLPFGSHLSRCLFLSPTHPSFYHFIDLLDPVSTSIYFKPLSMLSSTLLTFPLSLYPLLSQLDMDQPLNPPCIGDLSRRPRYSIIPYRARGVKWRCGWCWGVVGIVSNKWQIIVTLLCPLRQPPMHILRTANLQKHCLFLWSGFTRRGRWVIRQDVWCSSLMSWYACWWCE